MKEETHTYVVEPCVVERDTYTAMHMLLQKCTSKCLSIPAHVHERSVVVGCRVCK